MKQEVRDRLIVGLAQYLSAEAAGLSKAVIADGYQALDNLFSALLIQVDIRPDNRHNMKLKQVRDTFPHVFEEARTPFDEIDRHRQTWLAVRYSTSAVTPEETLHFRRLLSRLVEACITEVALLNDLRPDDLEVELYTEVQGGREVYFEEYCDHVHEKWQSDAEMEAEATGRSSLELKALNPSNYSQVRAFSEDETTRTILMDNRDVGLAIGRLYDSFLKLVEHVRGERFERGIALDEVPNFMLAIRFGYSGRTETQIGEEWARVIEWFNDPANKDQGGMELD